MKRQYHLFLACLLIITVILGGCRSEKLGSADSHTSENAEELRVFILGNALRVFYAEEDREEVLYTTYMSLGDYESTVCYGSEGFLYYQALKDYEEQSGVKLKLSWYQYPEQLEEALFTLDKSELPDLIITDFSSFGDFDRYMKQGIFYDLTPYTEEEGLYTEQKYYNTVLSAGKMDGKQYVLPLLFTVDTIMGSEENWARLDLHLENAETHEELMNALLHEQQEKEVEEVVGQWFAPVAYYTPGALYNGAGEKWVDYEKECVQLDQKRFYQMAEFYRNFLAEQFKEVKSGERLSWAEAKHLESVRGKWGEIDEYLTEKGCIIEGGASMPGLIHNAAAQAWYYENRFRDRKESFMLIPIPGQNQGVTAHVLHLGAVLSTCEKPQAAYHFLRYMMDAELFEVFGIPVNKERAEQMLTGLTELEYELRWGCQALQEDGSPYTSEDDYTLKPMSSETKAILHNMLENISSASLPRYPVYEILREQLESYAKGEISMEQAYEQAYNGLEIYLKEGMEN